MTWTNNKLEKKDIVLELQFWDSIKTISEEVCGIIEKQKLADQEKYIKKYSMQKELYELSDDQIWKLMSCAENNKLDLQNKYLNSLNANLNLLCEGYTHIKDEIHTIKLVIKELKLKITISQSIFDYCETEIIKKTKEIFKNYITFTK